MTVKPLLPQATRIEKMSDSVQKKRPFSSIELVVLLKDDKSRDLETILLISGSKFSQRPDFGNSYFQDQVMASSAPKPKRLNRIRRFVKRDLTGRTIGWNTERAKIVWQWIQQDFPQSPVPRRELTDVIDRGLEIYEQFNIQFSYFFSGQDSRGWKEIQKRIERRLHYQSEPLVEAVFGKILDRRVKLLRHFKVQHQGSLFDSSKIQTGRITGYFIRVANFETRSIPQDAFESPCGDLISQLSQESASQSRQVELFGRSGLAEETNPAFDSSVRSDALEDLIDHFWSPANHFAERERLQVLAQLLLGRLSGNPELDARCQSYLSDQIESHSPPDPAQTAQRQKLLLRRQQLQYQIRNHPLDEARVKLKRVEKQLYQLEIRERKRRWKILPKRAEWVEMLDGLVSQPDSARSARLRRERELLRQRVESVKRHWESQKDEGQMLPIFLNVAREGVGQFDLPPRSNEHGLPPEERTRRQKLEELHRRKTKDLLLKLFELRKRLDSSEFPFNSTTTRQVQDGLYDLEDGVRYGILERHGISTALRVYSFRRLRHLLRHRSSK